MVPVVALTFAVGVSVLLLTHLRFLLHNESSIECGDLNFDGNPYDLENSLDNLKQILGPNPWLWLVPTKVRQVDSRGKRNPHYLDGLHWTTI